LIIKPKPKDAAVISRMIRQTLRKVNSRDNTPKEIRAWSEANSKKEILKKILDESRDSVVVKDRSKVLGFGSMKGDEITSFYIADGFHGQGFGSRLLFFMERLSKQKGVKRIRLNSSLTAYKFYRKKGYRRIRRVSYVFNRTKIPCVLMSKKL